MPTVHDVADYLLWLADQDRIGVDHLKLQKLVYYAQGFHLGNEREPLFNEGLHAWQYGPVCPELWHRYRYRRDYLTPPPEPPLDTLSVQQRQVVELVYQRFRELPGIELIERTHQEAPWGDAAERAADGGSDLISADSMDEYFRGRLWILGENQEAPPPPDSSRLDSYAARAQDPLEATEAS